MREKWIIGVSITIALQFWICATMPLASGGDSVRSGGWSAGPTLLFAVLSFMGIGTLLGACLCCRRRKRGFEEFKNETPGNTEAAPQSEYPIFGALSSSSTPNGGSAALEESRSVVANHISASPAAPANACIVNGSTPPLIVNVNEVQTNHIYSAPIRHDVFDNNNGPISASDMENIENNNAEDYIANRNEIGVVVEPSFNAINRNSAPTPEDAIVHESSVVLDIEEESCVPNTQFSCDSMLPVLSTKSQSFLENLDLRTEFRNEKSLPKDDQDKEHKMCDDVKSIDSTTSGNSEIEEALMALESAIADEDTCETNEDYDMEVEDATMYEDVVKNLIGETMTMDVDDECKNHVDIEKIEAVARKLVDDVLEESEKIVFGMKQVEAEECKTQQDSVEILEKSIDSLEEVFFSNIESNKLLQSTPCVVNKITHVDSNANRRNLLFDETGDEINPETTFVKPANDGTFVCEGEAKKADGTFVCDSEANGPTIVIDKEKDEVISVDLTTITPVNTPIEVNAAYSVDNWYPQPSTSKACHSGWFLHPQKDEVEAVNDATFNKTTGNETYVAEDDDNNDDDSRRTFEALRRQLEQVLPHAQGIQNAGNYAEDDDSVQEKEMFLDFHVEDGASNVQSAKEIIINYQRRPLSPIAEESEDETTFKTFITNEAKYQDSTSTGIMETGEAIMGVSKTLMASNDTLFNFEDTLGDRDDQFSPLVEKKHLPSDVCSPVNSTSEKKGINLELNLTKTIEVNDLCSPEGAKTFSEDHLSSDMDPTCTTNTIEGETCISVGGMVNSNTNLEEDERISEISEPDWNSDLTSTDAAKGDNELDRNSLLDVDDIVAEEIDTVLGIALAVNGDGKSETESDNDTVKDEEESSHVVQVKKDERNDGESNGMNGVAKTEESVTKEGTIMSISPCDSSNQKSPPATAGDTKVEANDITSATDILVKDLSSNKFWGESAPVIYNKHHHPIANYNIYEIADYDGLGEEGGVMFSESQCLSGEEDPWSSPVMAQNTLTDIRYSVPACEMMSTSFTGADWDSDGNAIEDEDDSNSSEEFMYLKGLSSAETEKMYEKEVERENSSLNGPCDSDIWTSHQDKVPVHTDHSESPPMYSEDCSSDVEGEFIPSCWDSMALPARSAMKSPDKSSSEDDSVGGKNRRNVIFKVQMYHSVYEYPREIVPLSPAYSEPKVWNHHRDNLESSKFNAEAIDLDGFMVSSSTRPFHNSQFQAQCNTWPSDSDFSWSQLQDGEEEEVKYSDFSSIPVEWPKNLSDLSRQEEALRGGSGMNEFEESEITQLNKSTSLGDLCHQKPLLRLPLTSVSVTSTQKEDDGVEKQQVDMKNQIEVVEEMKEENEKFVLPTPSCTGSMDSLSSSSGSDRPINTFGKTTQSESFEDSLTSSREGSGDGSHQHESEEGAIDRENLINEVERRCQKIYHERSTRISDSTDEDSGIESVSRIIK